MVIWIKGVKLGLREAVQPLALFLARAGIQANWLTYTGFVLNLGVAALVIEGWLSLAGVVFLLVNALDFLDGAVARAAGTAGRYGAFLDSVLDRYSEAVVFVGLLIWFARLGDTPALTATALALIGSFMVSYCRARAEGLGLDCEVGLLQRPERIVILGIGMIAPDYLLTPVLILLAVLTNLTAAQRMHHVGKLFETRDRQR
ncbi:MAG: CDP-alcohol phosphatidyltransferase family protein [Chloroflexi bacterium]|nr:CDP-alcohol phosphatidyltransferase family protein [Chloroflexota bacterium]